uniref:Uncharacterized protein n=1 Tax=Rhizophora mucronata TaxID=61149 RepID=A0A2P2NPR6_RHIMU
MPFRNMELTTRYMNHRKLKMQENSLFIDINIILRYIQST